MLGLRRSLNERRRRKNSNSSSHVSEGGIDENSPSRAAMDSLRVGLSDSLTSLSGKSAKHVEPTVTVKETEQSFNGDDDANTLALSHTNSHNSTNGAATPTATSTKETVESASSGFDYFDRVKSVFKKVVGQIVRLDDYDETFVKETDLHAYLQFISDERLIHMPRRGSDWDRVLGAAQFFGLQIWSFGKQIEAYVPGGKDTAGAALASCQILLEIGHGSAQALLPTFVALYELAMLLSTVSHIRDLERMPASIRKDAANIFCELVSLTGSIAVYYRERISTLRSGGSATIDFDQTFGEHIGRIWTAKQHLTDHVWAHKLAGRRFSLSLPALRERLQGESQGQVEDSVRSRLYDEVADSLERSEDTCHWIKHELVQFLNSSDQVLCVTGGAGSGKTVLAEWVQERLSRPLDHKSYTVIDYNFAFDSADQSTAVACVKNLISQLLETSVGDVALYEQLVAAFEAEAAHRNNDRLEEALWKALRSGLQAAERGGASVVVITDGCDAIVGGDKKALAFHNSLRKAVSGVPRARVVTFSKPVSHLSEGCRHLVITQQELRDDIRGHLWQHLSRSTYFKGLSAGARDQIIEELTSKAKGNFLWAFYAGRLLQSASQEGFEKLRGSISSDISNVLQAVIEQSKVKTDKTVKNLLSWMVVANRSLTIQEAAELLAVNYDKRSMDKQALDILKYVPDNCGEFVVVRGGRLHFRSSTVLTFLQKQMGHTLLSLKEAHSSLTIRLLLFARLHLTSERNPLMEGLEDSVVDELLGSYHLLLYVVQNWTIHFKAAGFVGASGDIAIPKGFVDIFPATLTLSLLERACWHRHHTIEHVSSLHEFALKIREATFGHKHITVLQDLITLGHVHRTISVTNTVGAVYIVRAAKLGEIILSATSAIVAACASLFLSWTETIVITTRTEIVTYREEMIRIMITVCKHKHGHSSDEVIAWYERLAKLYIDIKEEEHATVVYRELYGIITVRFGAKSTEAGRLGKVFGALDVVLKGDDAEKDIETITTIFETDDDMDVASHLCLTMMIRLAASYVACGKVHLAERLYVSLWRRISIQCRTDSRVEVHIAKIQIALEYVKFLRSVRRSEEASNILICLWAEYEHYSLEVASLVVWIREIGAVCKSFGFLSISVSILTKVWGWFKAKGKVDDEEARRTTILITEVVEEITETTVTQKTTKITTTEVTETVVREIFELQLTRCKKTKVDTAFFSSCMALIKLYLQDAKLGEAEVVIKKSLEVTWKAILSAELKITLTEHSVTESILLARQLARCYHLQGLYDKAEHVYLRIYYACLQSTTVSEATLSEAIAVLVQFYEEHHRHDKVIEVYVEVLLRYRKHLGHAHALTIKTLYLVAAQCELLGHADTYKYYLEIVTVLNKGSKHCHHDAIKAALFLTKYYYARQQWTELREICVVVWETIVHHRKGLGLEFEIIEEIYKKYTYVLEFHAKVEFSILYQVTVQYKEVVVAVRGALSTAALLALIELAKICEKHESHHHESITLYEEVIKKITTTKTTEITITETTVRTVKTRLSKMYVTVITTGKAGKSVSVERAVQIALEAYVQLKIEFGCWHEKTLVQLKEVVILYHKLATKESHLKIVQLLQESVTEIITTVIVTTSLFAAAKTLASIYISFDMASKGHELLHQLRHLIIFRGGSGWSTGGEITLKLNVQVTRSVFAFLVAFELGLSGKAVTVSYSELMAGIIYESVLYEEYSRIVDHKETRIDVVLECGAKLRGFWVDNNRTHLLTVLDTKLLQLFKTSYASAFKTIGDEHVFALYLAVLGELGKDRQSTKTNFNVLVCRAGNSKVKSLVLERKFQQAHQVGRCVFQFSREQQLYKRVESIQYGYKLAEFLSGIDVPHPAKEEAVSKEMILTAQAIMKEVLAGSRAAGIDWVTLRFEDMVGLVRLLGAQENYVELEDVLLSLWERREDLQRSKGWSPTMVLQVGTLLVHAQQGHKHASRATDTAELLYYNVRRGRGRLHPETLAVARLLASLYVTNGRAAAALALHESVLREMASAAQHHQSIRADLAPEAKLQLERLRAALHLAKGSGKSSHGEVRDIYERLRASLKLELPAFDKWAEVNDTSKGGYVAIRQWTIERSGKSGDLWKRTTRDRSKQDANGVNGGASQWWLTY